ncbi:MAG: insulinase family protein, partial [Vreelandella alkaliphila]
MLRSNEPLPNRHAVRQAVIGVVIGVTWCTPFFAFAQDTPVKDAITPIVSPFDERDYRVLTLENGLQALLVSDPEADKAAASMNVRVGSAQDPDDLQGLAHFLEHMLFLGTEPYPQSDAYQRYISDNAGSHNAFTAQQDTNYFFDVEPSA